MEHIPILILILFILYRWIIVKYYYTRIISKASEKIKNIDNIDSAVVLYMLTNYKKIDMLFFQPLTFRWDIDLSNEAISKCKKSINIIQKAG